MGVRPLLASLCLAAAGLAGCGGGSSQTVTRAPASFVTQADTLCALAAAHETALAPGRVASLHDLARWSFAVVPVARGFAAALARLRAPAADRVLWRRYLARLSAQLDAEAAAGRAAARGDPAATRRAAAAVRAADPAPLAGRLGLSDCARTGGSSRPAPASPI